MTGSFIALREESIYHANNPIGHIFIARDLGDDLGRIVLLKLPVIRMPSGPQHGLYMLMDPTALVRKHISGRKEAEFSSICTVDSKTMEVVKNTYPRPSSDAADRLVDFVKQTNFLYEIHES